LAPADRGSRDSPAPPGSLRLRILSALVLAPIAIAAAWFGSPWLAIVAAIAGAVMAWEWAGLCRAGGFGRAGANGAEASGPGANGVGASGVVLIGAVLAAIGAAVAAEAGGGIAPAIGVSLLGAAIVFGAARLAQDGEPRWLALGALWIAVPCVLLLWLARIDGAGRFTVLWIFAIVWATDIGAYAIGRRLGGPLLWPRWSPRKTWAGLIGGAGCAALAGWGTARILMYIDPLGISSVLPLVLVSAGLAIVEQFGDLAESVAKRRFGVKDSSGLIPGHGGLLDRLDGLLAVVPAVALLTLIGGGSVVTWR
jgi:phosphatidate cytidylyltransferase